MCTKKKKIAAKSSYWSYIVEGMIDCKIIITLTHFTILSSSKNKQATAKLFKARSFPAMKYPCFIVPRLFTI